LTYRSPLSRVDINISQRHRRKGLRRVPIELSPVPAFGIGGTTASLAHPTRCFGNLSLRVSPLQAIPLPTFATVKARILLTERSLRVPKHPCKIPCKICSEAWRRCVPEAINLAAAASAQEIFLRGETLSIRTTDAPDLIARFGAANQRGSRATRRQCVVTSETCVLEQPLRPDCPLSARAKSWRWNDAPNKSHHVVASPSHTIRMPR
jgi:hypothetical protein